MSTPPNDPGWYQAPDGRWYPRVLPPGHGGPPPGYQPPPGQGPYGPPYPTHAYEPGAGVAPPPPPRRSNTGKIVTIVLVVFAVLVIGGGFALYRIVSGVSDKIVGDSGAGCSAVSAADVDAALGGSYDLVQLGGAIAGLAGPVLDDRVLPGATTTCWAVESGSSETGGRLVRIATYSGSDAAARFADERTKADGTTEDRGNGLSVSSPGYFNKVVQAGDQAFCTSGSMLGSAGVLVRRGNLLVYVSTTAAGDGAASVPDITLDPGAGPSDAIRFGTDDENCALAVTLAAKVH